MERSRQLRWGSQKASLVVCLLMSGLPIGSTASAEEPVAIGDEVLQKKWTEGLAMLSTGRFEQATVAIREIAGKAGEQEAVKKVDQWLADHERLQKERQDRIKGDYDKYVSWVHQDMEGFSSGDQQGKPGWWKRAMLDTARAYSTMMDEEAFRKEPWVEKVVQGALKAAAEYEEKSNWLSAASIYARLSDLFPLNKDYRNALKGCQSHIRLELTYTPESEWQNEVNSIVAEMAMEAFRKIESEYLREVDFKELVVEALEQVLRIAQEPPTKVFESLKDAEALQEFTNRVNVHLKRAREATDATVDDLVTQLNTVLRINSELKLLPETVLVYEFVQGALHPLDQFSDMIWPASVQEFQKHTQGKFSGVGIQIRKAPGDPILVVTPLKGSPAYEKGIRPGDLITKINGESANGYTITRAVREITGREGTTVRLTIKRGEQGQEHELEIERREIKISTIKGIERIDGEDWNFMIDPEMKIAYARLTNFTDECVEELQGVLDKLVKEEMRGLIFDLRDNPGGPLKAAVEISDMFLPGEKKVVSTKGRLGRTKPWAYSSTGNSPFTDFPMIVLVSPSSASASEIVAGALQVHNRGLIVGERSFGKGSVQQVFPLNDEKNAFLKLTTSRYYLPNGRCLHREDDATVWGVDPDVKVKLAPKEEVKIRQLQLRTDIMKGKNQKELTEADIKSVTEYQPSTKPADSATSDEEAELEEDGEDKPKADDTDEPKITREDDENKYPEIDPQLETGLLLMRIRLTAQQPWPVQHQEMAAKTALPNDG